MACTEISVMLLQFRNNLAARLGLLAQLQMKLPEGLNAAEEQLQDTELPNLDQQAQLLSKQIQVQPHLPSCLSTLLHHACLAMLTQDSC